MISARLDHDFASCSRTYATLSIYHDTLDPALMTKLLKSVPDRSQKSGDIIRPGKRARVSGWFLGTQQLSQSRDLRFHLELILEKISTKKRELKKLKKMGCQIWIMCFWESAAGNGGPILDHEVLGRLSEYPIDLHYDIWCDQLPLRKGKKPA